MTSRLDLVGRRMEARRREESRLCRPPLLLSELFCAEFTVIKIQNTHTYSLSDATVSYFMPPFIDIRLGSIQSRALTRLKHSVVDWQVSGRVFLLFGMLQDELMFTLQTKWSHISLTFVNGLCDVMQMLWSSSCYHNTKCKKKLNNK